MEIREEGGALVLYKEGTPVGRCTLEDRSILEFRIDPRWRRKGYGSYLLKEALRRTGGFEPRQPSCHRAPLPAREEELAFWEKFGFQRERESLVRRRRPDLSGVELSHRLVKDLCPQPRLSIDATCGNGYDTEFLCGLGGEVVALDIQPRAVENTRRRLGKAGLSNARVMVEDHARLDRIAAPGTVDCVMFNFGWLPGGDHTLHSQLEKSLAALEKALDLLRPGGVLSAVLYSGQGIGSGEKEGILRYLERLPLTRYTVIVCRYANYKDTAPLPCIVLKKG